MSSKVVRKKMEHSRLVVLRTAAYKAQRGRCIYCFEPMRSTEATADHVRPQVKHGLTRSDNIVVACRACNQLKGSLGAVKFRRLIKTPPPDPSIAFMLANFRRRLWLRTLRASNRIRAAVGLPTEPIPSIDHVVHTLTTTFPEWGGAPEKQRRTS